MSSSSSGGGSSNRDSRRSRLPPVGWNSMLTPSLEQSSRMASKSRVRFRSSSFPAHSRASRATSLPASINGFAEGGVSDEGFRSRTVRQSAILSPVFRSVPVHRTASISAIQVLPLRVRTWTAAPTVGSPTTRTPQLSSLRRVGDPVSGGCFAVSANSPSSFARSSFEMARLGPGLVPVCQEKPVAPNNASVRYQWPH